MKKSIGKAALHSATSLTAFAMLCGTASAQAASTDAGGDNAQADAILVTGSRIARPELDAPNPVKVVTAKDLQDAGTTNITDYLATIPALQNSATSFQTSGERVPLNAAGLNLLNLRNLGTNRTLVLIDGRRQVAAREGTQAVDINTIPTDLIERVEVLTGGASAVYGADGVSGVVNFIQKKDFEGLTGRVQAGLSSRGDAAQRLIAITAGHTFAQGRGNIALAWEHSEEDRLKTSQRKYLSGEDAVGFYLNPDANSDYQYVPLKNVRYNNTSRYGGIDVDFDSFPDYYGADATPFQHGTSIPGGVYEQGGSGTLVSDYSGDLLPQINRDVVSGIFHYDFSDSFTLYAEGKYARARSYTEGQPTYDLYVFVPQDNPYIPDAVRSQINPFIGGVLVNRDNFDFGRRGQDITRQTLRGVIGGKGSISPNLSYDLSYTYGETKVKSHYLNNVLSDRYYAAIDAVSDGAGGVTCRANVVPGWTPFQPAVQTRQPIPPTTFSPGDCIPLNLFTSNRAENQAAIDWMTADTVDHTTITQHVVSGAITGNTKGMFELPGGPVGFAVGGEYRKEKSVFVPDELIAQGLTYSNALSTNKGSFDVWEAFGEVNAPILADAPFAKRLSVNGAFRYSHYSTVGSTNSWKLGGDWAPVSDITFRGTYSKAVRAPNIAELFGTPSQTYQTIDDPCSTVNQGNGTRYRENNCATLLGSLGADADNFSGTRSVSGTTGGNAGLKEENAHTWTAGIVLQPSFIPRLTITADWYDIRIKNAIISASAAQLAALCVDQSSLDNQFCDLVIRQNGGGNAGQIVSYTLAPYNVAQAHTSGLDWQISYVVPTEKAGTFGIRVSANYLHRLTSVPIPGADTVNEAYVAANMSPKFQSTTDLTWAKGPFSLDWQVNYMSKMYRYDRQTIESNPNIVAPKYLKLKERFTHDVSFNYDVDDRMALYGGVNNLFDQKPAIGSKYVPVSAVGRYFFIGARVKMPDFFGGAK